MLFRSKRLDLIQHESVSASALSALLKKNILEEDIVIVDRLNVGESQLNPLHQLSDLQRQALAEIKTNFDGNEIILLHGVTSSGKTELYTHLIDETLKKGQQILYLLPEIALTTQMIQRLRKHFGNAVGVYHSRFTSNERAEKIGRAHV